MRPGQWGSRGHESEIAQLDGLDALALEAELNPEDHMVSDARYYHPLNYTDYNQSQPLGVPVSYLSCSPTAAATPRRRSIQTSCTGRLHLEWIEELRPGTPWPCNFLEFSNSQLLMLVDGD